MSTPLCAELCLGHVPCRTSLALHRYQETKRYKRTNTLLKVSADYHPRVRIFPGNNPVVAIPHSVCLGGIGAPPSDDAGVSRDPGPQQLNQLT